MNLNSISAGVGFAASAFVLAMYSLVKTSNSDTVNQAAQARFVTEQTTAPTQAVKAKREPLTRDQAWGIYKETMKACEAAAAKGEPSVAFNTAKRLKERYGF